MAFYCICATERPSQEDFMTTAYTRQFCTHQTVTARNDQTPQVLYKKKTIKENGKIFQNNQNGNTQTLHCPLNHAPTVNPCWDFP